MTKKIKITDTKSSYLSVGKVYEVINEFDDCLDILDNEGDLFVIDKIGDSHATFQYVNEEEGTKSSESKPSGFSKKDLVAGKHIVKLADGSVGLVVYLGDELWVLFEDDNCMTLRDQEEDLSYSEESYFDIVEVYKISSCFISKIFNLACHELVWKKNPKKKMTLKEIEEAGIQD